MEKPHLSRLAGSLASGRRGGLRREMSVALQLLLHLWLVAVFPVSHALSDARLASERQSVEWSAAVSGVDRVGEPDSGDGHTVPCVFCRVLTSPLFPADQSDAYLGPVDSGSQPLGSAPGYSSALLPSPVARGPPALIG